MLMSISVAAGEAGSGQEVVVVVAAVVVAVVVVVVVEEEDDVILSMVNFIQAIVLLASAGTAAPVALPTTTHLKRKSPNVDDLKSLER
jgi:hypothetical protein